jgi:hypothetical protein
MRPRRSPRNQARLWRELGREGADPEPPKRSRLEVAVSVLASLKADPCTRQRTVREAEREVARLKMREAAKR